MIHRADVVIARFPYTGSTQFKVRPAVVVQCDRLNNKIHNTVLAMVTGNTKLALVEPTQLLIDPTSPEGAFSGLTMVSAVKCENLSTVPQADIIDVVGHLSDALTVQLNECLKAALDLK
jgi:mRNA-degrading endonuclease toxin of MazEF toxin-antitoxin module